MTARAIADAKRVAQRIEILPTVIYVGYADYVGTTDTAPADSSASWTIKKITLVSGNPTAVEWTVEGAGVWDNRASESYE